MHRNPATTHAAHDELLLARLYGDDVNAAEREAALDQMASCESCADFFADLGSIAAAVAAMPVPTRPRDFELTAADAARLRRVGLLGSAVSGLVARTRALGRAMVAVGVAGVVVIGVVSALSPSIGSTSGTTAYDSAHGTEGQLAAAPVTNGSSPNYPVTIGPDARGSAGTKSGDQSASGSVTPPIALATSAPSIAALLSQPVPADASPAATSAASAVAAGPTARDGIAGGVFSPAASGCTGPGACEGGPVVSEPTPSGQPFRPQTETGSNGPDLRLAGLVGFAGLLVLGLLLVLWTRSVARKAGR
jgi:hypothetical protein